MATGGDVKFKEGGSEGRQQKYKKQKRGRELFFLVVDEAVETKKKKENQKTMGPGFFLKPAQ